MPEYAGIHILKSPYHIDQAFDYFLPPHLRSHIAVGDFVTVPFGNANRQVLGLTVSLKDTPDEPAREHKPVLSLCSKELSLSPELLGLCFFMKEQTLCTVGDAVRAMLPSAALTKPEEVYRLADADGTVRTGEELYTPDGTALLICECIRKKGSVGFDFLKSKFGPATKGSLRQLTESGLVVKDYAFREASQKTVSCYRLAVPPHRALQIANGQDSSVRLRSEAHGEILRFLAECDGECPAEKEIAEACRVTAAQLRALCDKGLVQKVLRPVDRSLDPLTAGERKPFVLSEEQARAFETLRTLADSGEPKGALLHGVTGSGKTCVMMALIDHVLASQRSVILLLPEIALTPQTLSLFCSRYGERVAIIHSGLSEGERLDTYRRIRSGGADVVIGTRSAVFAPLTNLGLIILDEEQEHTYKSDMNPKYHARDVARYRCAKNRALMLLASATPSFESYYKAQKGIYTLISLRSRFGKAVLPKTTIVDLRKEPQAGNTSPLGTLLCQRLIKNRHDGNQSVLFLNRRGYHHFVSCRSCGKAVSCPTCSVSMTYHTLGRSYEQGELRCHWCGRRMPVPTTCPDCKSEHLARFGYGTQRVEQELNELLPEAKVLRMDTDTTTAKHSYEEMLGCFRRGEADILLGTQMVTKGHDFPNVTLVGVLSADSSLFLDDYRAAERTFAMLTQVIGRAGRADKPGEAIIQTTNPAHECIRLACEQNYDAFYQNEIRLRRELLFPPFCDIVLITLSSADEPELLKASSMLANRLQEELKGEYSDLWATVFGPFEAPVYKVENKYRIRLVVKCLLGKRSRGLFAALLSEFSGSGVKGLAVSVDFNPSTL
ncbi:MAG: primosomal protein N' [Clostridia bacterium]|nr:primosomal protein N' [Clostridia bacterium]